VAASAEIIAALYNKAMLFDGRALACKIEEKVREAVKEKDRPPRLASLLVGSDPASELYTRLKQEAARRVGIEFEVIKFTNPERKLGGEMEKIGEREDVDGVMVQLPLPGLTRAEQTRVVQAIPLTKDVDGLRWEESGIVPATVRAILTILERVDAQIPVWQKRFVVVGDRGSVGRPLVHYLRQKGVKVVGVNRDTREMRKMVQAGEVVVSCSGQAGVVTAEMVQEGVVLVDVGAPRAEFAPEAYEKAGVVVPAPGGVGPVTIASLLQNAIELVESGDDESERVSIFSKL